jgi:hypothetical protein
VRDHLNRLEVKGHVRTWQRRRGVHPDAHKWYTPTKSAKLVMFDHLHPELIQ